MPTISTDKIKVMPSRSKRAKQSPSASSMAVGSGALTRAKMPRKSHGGLLCSVLSASALGGCIAACDGRGFVGSSQGSGRGPLSGTELVAAVRLHSSDLYGSARCPAPAVAAGPRVERRRLWREVPPCLRSVIVSEPCMVSGRQSRVRSMQSERLP